MVSDNQQPQASTRGLIDVDMGPLRRFTGVLDSCPREPQTYGEGESARTSWKTTLNFKELDVLEAIEPYHFPITTIGIPESNKKKSKWGVFSEGTPKDRTLGLNNVADQQYSADQLDPGSPNYVPPKNRMDLNDCIGKRIGMVVCDGEEGRPDKPDLYDGREKKDVPQPAWTVYLIEGVGVASGGGGTDPRAVAKKMLDGKTLPEFSKEAMNNPVIRKDSALVTEISLPVSAPNSFVNVLVNSGEFTKDADGRYHLAEVPF